MKVSCCRSVGGSTTGMLGCRIWRGTSTSSTSRLLSCPSKGPAPSRDGSQGAHLASGAHAIELGATQQRSVVVGAGGAGGGEVGSYALGVRLHLGVAVDGRDLQGRVVGEQVAYHYSHIIVLASVDGNS